jgi:hypothetical protein
VGSAVEVAAQDEAGALRLVTEEVEPGVERIISDGAGHDLDETHPSYRYDLDGVAIAADGTVWLMTTHHGSDNPGGAQLWALGRRGTYRRPAELYELITLADGTLLGLTDVGIRRFDSVRWGPDKEPRLRSTAHGGLPLLLEEADLTDLSEGQVADPPSCTPPGTVRAGSTSGSSVARPCPRAATGAGSMRARTGAVSAARRPCTPGAGNRPATSPAPRSTNSQQRPTVRCGPWATTTAAPGGLYRITLPEPDAEQPIPPPRLPAPWRRRPD